MPRSLITRFLHLNDIPALLRLEARQWNISQAADASALRTRLNASPNLCVGVFCPHTGEALASLFMKPIAQSDIKNARNWAECGSSSDTSSVTKSLFGISLTSVDPLAVSSIFEFFWPYALKNGWKNIYLGSPIPGLKRALADDPELDIESYVHSRRRKLPRDAQLRYYYHKGFTDIITVLPNYFPHEASLDYGVLIRGDVPLSWLCPVWSILPIRRLQKILGWIARITNGPGLPAGAHTLPHTNEKVIS